MKWEDFTDFLKTPNNGYKMCDETMRNMWSCFFFPFCNVQNYGNLVFLSWKIIEIFLGLFVGTLIIQNCSLDTQFEIAFRWMPQNLTNEKSTLFSGNDFGAFR